jgi:hypothetical protein
LILKKYKVQQYEFKYHPMECIYKQSQNATFLFHRDFMEYHEERFHDYSLLIFEEDKLIAVPANRVGDTVYSIKV